MDIAYQGNMVVFDLDDTLYAERFFVASGYETVARSVVSQLHISAEELAEAMMREFDLGRNPFDYIFDKYPVFDEDDRQAKIGEWVDIYRYHIPRITLPDDSRQLLDALSHRGIRMGLLTDGRSKTQRNKISSLGIDKYFHPDNIRISEETGVDKTSAEAFAHFVRNHPNARQFIYIADNPAKDFLQANLLGWTTICLRDHGINIHPQTMSADPLARPSLMIDSLTDYNPE